MNWIDVNLTKFAIFVPSGKVKKTEMSSYSSSKVPPEQKGPKDEASSNQCQPCNLKEQQ